MKRCLLTGVRKSTYPLWSLNHSTLNIADTRQEIEELETSFHRSLEPVVPRVLGDTND